MENQSAQLEATQSTTKSRECVDFDTKNSKTSAKSNKQCQTRTLTERQKTRKEMMKNIEAQLDGHEITEEEVSTVGKALYELSLVFSQ